MYHQDYDEVDAPVIRKPRHKTGFQHELDATIKLRRSRGLAADVTPSEGSDEEDDLVAQYTKSAAARQRPGSAVRRPERPSDRKVNLGETLRPRDADNMFARHTPRDDQLDNEVASYDTKGMPRIGAKTSPLPKSESLFGRKTPTGKKTPTHEQHEMTKEELIFGRKTPTHDQGRQGLPDSIGKKPWTPPTFQTTTAMDPEPGHRTPSPGSRGRQTPSSLLDPISEGSPRTPRDPYSNSLTPRGDSRNKPRLVRQQSTGSDKSPRPLTFETSPRGPDQPSAKPRGKGGQTEVMKGRKTPPIGRKTPPIGRKTPPVDIFGPQRREVDDDDIEVDSASKSRFRNKDADTGRTTPTGRFGGRKTPEILSGRKTPTGKTLPGRKTPEILDGRKISSGRKTPTGRRTPTEKEPETIPEKKPEKKSVLDFMNMMTEGPVKPQPKPQAKTRRKSKADLSQGSGDSDDVTSSYRRSSRTPPPRKKSEDRFNERGYDDRYEDRRDGKGYEDKLDGRGYGEMRSHRGYEDRFDERGYGDHLDRRGHGDVPDGKEYSDHNEGRGYGDRMDGRRFDSGTDRFDGRRYDLGRTDGRRGDSGEDRLDGRRYDSGKEQRGYEDIIGQAQEGDRMDGRRYDGRDRRKEDGLDQSSVCEELEREPGSKKRPTKEGEPSHTQEKDTRKHQTSSTRALDSAISEVAKVQYEDKLEATGSKHKQLPKPSDSSKHKPKPRYPTLPGETTPKDVVYEDANSIREAIYQQWYAERMEKSKKELIEKKKKEKGEEEKKKQALEEKLTEAKLSYNAWVDKKKDTVFKAKGRQKREELKKSEEDAAEKEKKRREAAGLFEHWKETKDEVITEKMRKQRREEERKKLDEEDKKYLRTKNSETAFRGWKAKKDVILEKQSKDEKTKKKKQMRDEEYLKVTKDEEAVNRYQEWMKEKERSDRMNRQRSMRSEDDYRPPWSPANRTVPFGH